MEHIHVTVAAIIERNNQFLLVKERASSGDIVFNQPAGHVELKESIIEAVVREVQEETGLDFNPSALIGTYLLSPAANGKTYLRFCFVGDVPHHQTPNPQDPDIIENCWFSLEEITNKPRRELRSALVLQCLNDYLNGKRIAMDTLSYFNDEHGLADQCYHSLKQ